MKEHYDNGPLKDHLDCKNYLQKYFIPLTNGSHVYIENGKDFVNASGQLKRDYKPFASFSEEIKQGVQMMLDFIKEIWANNNELSYDYLLKWFANVVKGFKNQTALYGKCIEGDKDILLTPNNMSVLGKILVVFEELPVLNVGEWNVCDGKLKDWITGDEMNYADKYEKKIKAPNISNMIVLTNHKALKRPDGRRYFIVDLNTKYQGNFKYFEQLRQKCFNHHVGLAFYCYLMEIDVSKFKSHEMPITDNKKDAIVELLTPIEKFLKFQYVLKSRNVKCKLVELYNEYLIYLDHNHSEYKSEKLTEFS
eukprot:gene18189-25585_t